VSVYLSVCVSLSVKSVSGGFRWVNKLLAVHRPMTCVSYLILRGGAWTESKEHTQCCVRGGSGGYGLGVKVGDSYVSLTERHLTFGTCHRHVNLINKPSEPL
jgi:hypothetical protein